jgi:MFS family permease
MRKLQSFEILLPLAATAGAYARTTLNPLQESMRTALSFSDGQMALLQGPAMALPLILLSVPLGMLVDRRSRVRLLFLLVVLGMAGSLLTAAVSDFTSLFIVRCFVGLAAFAVNPVVLSLIGDFHPPAWRGRATMAMAIGQFVGMSAAFALGGALLTNFGVGPAAWRWTLVTLTAPLLPIALLLLVLREPARTGVVLQDPPLRQTWVELWSYRFAVVPLLIGLLMLEVGIGAVLVWIAPVFTRDFHMASDRIGSIVAIGLAVSGVVGPVIGGFLADAGHRAGGPRRTMSLLAGLALLSVPIGAFAVAPGIITASALLVAFMTLIGAMVVMGTALFTVVIPGELRGLCMSMLAAACVLFGTGIAPLTVSSMSGVLGGPSAIGRALAVVCVGSGIIASAVFWMGRRRVGAHEHLRSVAARLPLTDRNAS